MTITTSNTSVNLYPFITKATIKAQLAESAEYRKEACCILFKLQTEWEQSTAQTKDRNRQGFMSSHAVWGTKCAKKILAGEELSEEETARMDSIVTHYSRQLAAYYRAVAIAENPALKAVAALFSSDK